MTKQPKGNRRRGGEVMTRSRFRVETVDWWTLPKGDKKATERIYNSVFPPNERPPIELTLSTGSRLWLGRIEAEIVAFAMAVELRDTDAALLQYIGVDVNAQSRGFGAALLTKLADDLTRGGVAQVFLEIEDPFAADATTQALRRLRFYENWGARPITNARSYYIPDFTDPRRRISMILLWRPLAPDAHPPDKTALKKILTAIYHSEYARVVGPEYLADLLAAARCS